MSAAAQQLLLLLELEARHDELLARLEQLDRQVAEALAQQRNGAGPGSRVGGPNQRGKSYPVGGGAPAST
ncbi:MAG: hypothetical protein ACUVUC_14840 [Thermoguttaceae bacterium]